MVILATFGQAVKRYLAALVRIIHEARGSFSTDKDAFRSGGASESNPGRESWEQESGNSPAPVGVTDDRQNVASVFLSPFQGLSDGNPISHPALRDGLESAAPPALPMDERSVTMS